MADNVLTRKVGPFAGWQWIALVGGGAGVVLYLIRARKAAAADSGAGTAGTLGGAFDPAGPLPGPSILAPIIIQTGNNSTATKPDGKPANPVRAFITGADFMKLSAAQKKQWAPFTTAAGARGYVPKVNVTPELSVSQYRNLAPQNQKYFVKGTGTRSNVYRVA